ncbi:MAG: tyrosine--tRNA ligase [Planctomycetota bacterium]|jgi:tyrosyl-tRNA synthetase
MATDKHKTRLSAEKQLEALRRGTVEITTEADLLRKLRKSEESGKPLRVKFGVDPTSPDIHLGHTVVLRKLRRFQDLGHTAVLIIGDYTALVGDPSGQNKTRPSVSAEDVEHNARTYLDQVDAVLDVKSAEIVRNGDWFKTLSFKQLLELAARVTVARIMERDDFAKRWAAHQPIAMHELLYPVMQGYDSIMVKADVELGGTDQMFNLLMGRQMQRDAGQEPQVTLTMPLLVGLDGAEKMSKSQGNYVGVTDAPNEMFGKVMSIPDDLMENYFELLTSLPPEEYGGELAAGHPRETKALLARTIVEDFHDADAARAAEEAFDRVFRERQAPEDIPEVQVSRGDLEDGKIWIIRLLTTAGLAASNSEARRLVAQGGVQIDGERVKDTEAAVEVSEGMILKVGKRRFARIKLPCAP